MYYHNNPNVVETDDILGIAEMEFEPAQEGTYPLLKLTCVLDPNKTYTPQQLHVTNGVEPRLLSPGYEPPALETPEAETTAQATPAEESPQESEGETTPETVTTTGETAGTTESTEGQRKQQGRNLRAGGAE